MALSDEYYKMTRHLLDEAVSINRKYDFSHVGRSEQDEARSKQLWAEMERVREDFDAKHPLPQCPECGGERKASLDGVCTNWDECSLCPPLGG